MGVVRNFFVVVYLGIFLAACSGGKFQELSDQDQFKPDTYRDKDQLVADSVADFSSHQGEKGWMYGYFEGCSIEDAVNCLDEFEPLSFFPAQDWWATSEHGTPGSTFTVLKASQAHPHTPSSNADLLSVYQSAVRRWESSVSGNLVVKGKIAPATGSFATGDGTTAFILLDGVQKFKFELKPNDLDGIEYELDLKVSEDSIVDFVLEGHENHRFDSTIFTAQITLLADN